MDYFSQAISLSLLQGTKGHYNNRSKLIRGNTKSVLEMTLRDFKPFHFLCPHYKAYQVNTFLHQMKMYTLHYFQFLTFP